VQFPNGSTEIICRGHNDCCI